MQQLIDAIAKPSTERGADVKQTEVVLNLSISLDSLVEVITKLGLSEGVNPVKAIARSSN
jgi:hypothetical protein